MRVLAIAAVVLFCLGCRYIAVKDVKEKRVGAVLFGKNDISNRLITSSNLVMAFPAYMPIMPGHILVCPRRIVATMAELTSEEKLALLGLVEKIKQALKLEFGAEGFNVAWNHGAIAGQTVPHLHIHIVPRSSNDGGIADYEPRQFLYRPGERGITPDAELEEVAKSLAQHIE